MLWGRGKCPPLGKAEREQLRRALIAAVAAIWQLDKEVGTEDPGLRSRAHLGKPLGAPQRHLGSL